MPGPARSKASLLVVYAGFWRRVWAFCLDITLLSTVAGMVALLTHQHLAGEITLAMVVVYMVGLTLEGGTVGMRIMRLRVVRTDGRPLNLLRSAVRNLVLPVSVASGLGVMWMTFTGRRRAWHDLAAGTVVVHELLPPPYPEWADHPPWMFAHRDKATGEDEPTPEVAGHVDDAERLE